MIGMYNANAQDAEKTVTITCSGSGKTQDEAKQNALRSAIEQAFGAFISSKTEVLNDNVVSDQITSVASGNIQSYTVESEIKLPTETWNVTVKSIVSLNKLVNFAESKGFNIDLKGSLFVINIKQKIINEEGEVKGVLNLIPIVHELMQNAFDYKISTSTPTSESSKNDIWKIKLEIQGIANKNMVACSDYFLKTMQAIGLSQDEVREYLQMNKKVYVLTVCHLGKIYPVYLRNKISRDIIERITGLNKFYAANFSIKEKKSQATIDIFPLPNNFFQALHYFPDISFFPKREQPGFFNGSEERIINWKFFGFGNRFTEYELFNSKLSASSQYLQAPSILRQQLSPLIGGSHQEIRDKFRDSVTGTYKVETFLIDFLNLGELGCTFIKELSYKLDEISKIEGFACISNGNMIPFKRNGLLFKDSLNNEFILPIIQPEQEYDGYYYRKYYASDNRLIYNTNFNLSTLSDLKTKNILGENNLRLPTWEEGKTVLKFIYMYGLICFWDIELIPKIPYSEYRPEYTFLTLDNNQIQELNPVNIALKPKDRLAWDLDKFTKKNPRESKIFLVKSYE
jgi:hypothetical protein